MNILFLTQYNFSTIHCNSIYPDLVRELLKRGHNVYVVSPLEKKEKQHSYFIKEGKCTILRIRTGNVQKNRFIEKGLTMLRIESVFKNAIIHYFSNIHFSLVLYSTPPITFYKPVKTIKKRDDAFTYLMLKDIFPQNAIDIGIIKTDILGKCIGLYFRNKEKRLYSISDYIGCMSLENVNYLKRNNPFIDESKIGICPNSIEVIDRSISKEEKELIRKELGIPLNKTIIIYGGNLGKPQGIHFLIKCLQIISNEPRFYFLIIGDGTEYNLLNNSIKTAGLKNVRLIRYLPQEKYNRIVAACDIGSVFLDYRFTIPNYPSRILSYMQSRLPVLVCTDPNTDIGKTVVDGNFGWSCKSNDPKEFEDIIRVIDSTDRFSIQDMGNNAYNYLNTKFNVSKTVDEILVAYNNYKKLI